MQLQIKGVKLIAVAILGGVLMQKVTLNVKEVAELLGVSITTVYTMAKENEIPCKKLRGRIVFHRETIDKWLATPTAK